MPAPQSQTTILSLFFIQALAGGGIFARIPDIQTGLGLTESILGVALVGGSAGGLIANLFAGQLIQRVGTRAVMLFGIPALAAINAVLTVAPNVSILFAVLVFAGAAFSFTNVAMNVEADRIETASGQRLMNRCHGFWSMGMLFAAAIGVGARAWPISPPVHLWSVVIPISMVVVLLAYPMVEAAKSDAGKDGKKALALPSLRTVQIMLFGISASIGQMAAQNWSVIYMRDTFAAPDWLDTLVLPTYLLALTIGRIFADGWINRLGAKPVAFGLTFLAFLGCVCVAMSPFFGGAVIGFALLGVGSAVHFPLMITAAARSSTRPSAEAISAAIFLTGLAMTITPGIMGWVAEFWGLRIAFGILMLPFLVSLSLVRRVVH